MVSSTKLQLEPPSSHGSFWSFYKPGRAAQITVLAPAQKQATWGGGFSNAHMDIAPIEHRSAFLAKFDPSGRPLWKRTYGPGSVTGVLPLASGAAEILVDRQRAASAIKVDADGAAHNKVAIPGAVGMAMGHAGPNRFIVAGLTREFKRPAFREDVAVWIVDASRKSSGPFVVRSALNTEMGLGFSRVDLLADDDGAYVASSFQYPFAPKPTEMAYVAGDGRVAWRRTIPDSIVAGAFDSEFCTPTMTRLANGDALAACALAGTIHLIRFDRRSGDVAKASLPLPECQRSRPASLFLVPNASGELILVGSRPSGNTGPNCSWIGRLKISQ